MANRRGSVQAAMAAAMISIAFLGPAAPAANAENKPFPDDWFFDGAQRPATLKALEGKPAAEITAASWIGGEVSIKASRGKVVVLDFWATWCGPCMAAIPENVKLNEAYKDKDLVFIGVHDANSGADKAPAVVKEKGINYSIAIDKAGSSVGVSTSDYHVQFWPTYVAIDRSGIVRAVGLTPNHVEDVVKALLAEAGPTGDAAPAPEFAGDSFYGGDNRPAGFKGVEGKPAAKLAGAEWLGKEPDEAALKNNVIVLHFTSPASYALKELDKLAPLAGELGAQGVVFIGVCDSRASWDAMKKEAEKRKLALPIAFDKPGEKKGDAPAPGQVAAAFGVEYFPATIVIDRAGRVRAAGVKADKLKPIIEKLLAERAPEPKPAA